jgi:hypothetical protein
VQSDSRDVVLEQNIIANAFDGGMMRPGGRYTGNVVLQTGIGTHHGYMFSVSAPIITEGVESTIADNAFLGPFQYGIQIGNLRQGSAAGNIMLSPGRSSHSMAAVLVRRVLGLVATVAIGLLPVVPPEHVHEVEEHGHFELVVHRHVQAHGVAPRDEHSAVDHDDAPVATLDQDYIAPSPPHAAAPGDTAFAALAPPAFASRLGLSAFVERLIHAPPRGPTPDRGPPSYLTR